MKRLILIITLTVTLLWTGTAAAQAQAAGLLDDILGEGGAIPVEDVNAKGTGYWVLQILRTLKILEDHILQARVGAVSMGNGAGPYLKEQAEERYGHALTYGAHSASSEDWPETFSFDFTWENGGWLESDLETEKRALDTQRTMLRLLEKSHEEFLGEEEEDIPGGIVDAINKAGGRNQLLAQIGGAIAKSIDEQRKNRQLLMTIGNGLFVDNAVELNRIVKREAQARAFFDNFGKPVAFPEFTDRGL